VGRKHGQPAVGPGRTTPRSVAVAPASCLLHAGVSVTLKRGDGWSLDAPVGFADERAQLNDPTRGKDPGWIGAEFRAAVGAQSSGVEEDHEDLDGNPDCGCDADPERLL
jgi:hypothetical protein